MYSVYASVYLQRETRTVVPKRKDQPMSENFKCREDCLFVFPIACQINAQEYDKTVGCFVL